MSEPYVGYAERDPEPERLDPDFVADELRAMPGDWYRTCPTCQDTTRHVAWTDQHGCEFASGCATCFTIQRYSGCAYARAMRDAGGAERPDRRAGCLAALSQRGDRSDD